MSPHGIIFFTALALGFVGKLLFPQSSIRVALAAAAVFPVGAVLYFEDVSLLGFFIAYPLSLLGSAIGVALAKGVLTNSRAQDQ